MNATFLALDAAAHKAEALLANALRIRAVTRRKNSTESVISYESSLSHQLIHLFAI